MDFKEAFGRELKQYRRSRNITQEALAEMIGIHPRQVSKIETGEHFPNVTTLENICIALSISPKVLFGFELSEITASTGTGDKYTYKAVVEGNVVYIDNNNFRKQKVEKVNSSDEIDVKMVNIAKKTGRPITIQYYNDGENYKTIEYNPDGTHKIIKSNKDKEVDMLSGQIKRQLESSQGFDYYKLAEEALRSDAALDKFIYFLNGMKMARK